MNKILYDVPLEAQQKSDTCWHASAFMIWRYWQGVSERQGPMHSLGNQWQNNSTISLGKGSIELAKRVGLHDATTIKSHTSSTLHQILKSKGPIWCAGKWFGFGHVIVLTGINGNTVYFNDPDGGRKKWGSVGWFNLKAYSQYAGYMLAKDPKAY